MKVGLKKKRALAAAVLLSLSCYGQAWADTVISDDKTIVAGATETLGAANEKLSIESSNIFLGQGATFKMEGSQIDFNKNTNIEGNGTIDISADSVNFGYANGRYLSDYNGVINTNVNADVVQIKSKDNMYWHAVKINQDERYKNAITQIEGFIEIDKDAWQYDYTGNHNNNPAVKINFNGKESYFKGNIWISGYYSTGAELTFDNGAKWIFADCDSASGKGMYKDNARSNNRLTNLNLLNGSVLDFNTGSTDEYTSLNIWDIFNGDGGIVKMSFDGSVDPEARDQYGNNLAYVDHLYTSKHEGDTTIILKNISKDTSYILGKVLVRVAVEEGTFKGGKEEGALSWTNYQLAAKKWDEVPGLSEYEKNSNYTYWVIDKYTQEYVPTTSVNTLLSTVTAGYDTWRNDTDKLNERMGELRLNGAGNDGVWVRTKGSEFGRHGGNGSYTNKQQTYQLGYDAVTSKDDKQTTYTGVAAEYGKGSLSFDSGTGTMKSLGLGVYQTKMYESGHYLDLVGRFDKYKNDFHVADTQGNAISGKYGNNALSLSAEYGRKNELKHGWYVEPQSEVTLGYMFGNDFTTSNNIRVEQKNMPALIGRLGLNVGREVNDKVNFYVKASVNHDFLGNYDVQMTDMTSGERLGASDRFGSSWFDYGAGLSVKTGKDSYAYFDIERAVGGEYKKNWDWNAGVRWSF